MIGTAAAFLIAFLQGLTLAVILKSRSNQGDFGAIIISGMASGIVSLAFVPFDKDGHLNLLWSAPIVFVSSVGAAIGCFYVRFFGEDKGL